MSASEPIANAPAPVNKDAHAPADAPAQAQAEAIAPAQADAIAPVEALPPGAADEMIAQAAGEQIDQLLAKADVERIGQEDLNAVAPAAPADIRNIPAVANQPDAEKRAQKPGAPVTEQKAGFSEFSATDIQGKPAPDAAPAKGKPEAAAVGADESSQAQEAPSQPPASAADAPSQPPAPDADAVESDDDAPKEQEKIPAWLIPLELINRPFEMFPDSVRTALGKAAILTLINATALLIYVFKFRK